jgi:hypothetical protein
VYISFYTFVHFSDKSLVSAHSYRQETIAADSTLRSALGKRDAA